MNLKDLESVSLHDLIANKVITLYIQPGVNFPEELSLDNEGSPNFALGSASVIATDLAEILDDPMLIISGLHEVAMELHCAGIVHCKKFSSSKKKTLGHVYLMLNARNGYTKIGFTTKEPEYRESTLQSEEPEVELFFKSSKSFTLDDEKEFHEIYAEKRVRGEWFDLSGDDIEEIKIILGGAA